MVRIDSTVIEHTPQGEKSLNLFFKNGGQSNLTTRLLQRFDPNG
jgi:hypothetical protein